MTHVLHTPSHATHTPHCALVDCAHCALCNVQQVYSGLRFVKRAVANGTPVAVLNIGPTCADDLCTLKVEASCAEVLQALLEPP